MDARRRKGRKTGLRTAREERAFSSLTSPPPPPTELNLLWNTRPLRAPLTSTRRSIDEQGGRCERGERDSEGRQRRGVTHGMAHALSSSFTWTHSLPVSLLYIFIYLFIYLCSHLYYTFFILLLSSFCFCNLSFYFVSLLLHFLFLCIQPVLFFSL